jgi:pimeloyl-ACP methyl ester carboxylesterase
MIKVTSHSIAGSNNKPILIDLTSDEKQVHAPLVVFVHGFKGFKDWGAHHLVARYFAQNGFRYLKFNLSHSGVDVERPNDVTDLAAFANNTVSKEMLDVDLVLNYALTNLNVNQVFVIGHSRGGGLAILQAANNPKIAGLATWSAIADFGSLWKKDQESQWKEEGKIFVENARTKEKMPLNVSLLEDYQANKETFDILKAAKRIDIPWLIVQGDEDVNVPFETAQKLANANPSSKLIKIEGANHVYGASHPYGGETMPQQLFQVCEKTLTFLRNLI